MVDDESVVAAVSCPCGVWRTEFVWVSYRHWRWTLTSHRHSSFRCRRSCRDQRPPGMGTPYRDSENRTVLAKVGFEPVDQIFRWYNFAVYLAVKPRS